MGCLRTLQRYAAVTLLLLLFSAPLLPAQSPRVRMVLPEASDSVEQRYNQVVADTVALSLSELGFELVEPNREAEMEIEIESAPFPPRLHLSISAYDLESGTLVAGINGSGRTNVTLLNSIDRFVEQLEPRLREYKAYLQEADNPFVPVPEVRELRFLREDEKSVEVSLGHGPRLLTAEEEEAQLEGYRVTLGSELLLRYEAPFSQPKTEVVEIRDPSRPIVIPELPNRERFSAQLQYSMGRMVGFGFGGRWYPVPDVAFLALETDLFMSGVGTGAPNRILHNEYRLLFGWRPGLPEQRFRVDLSAGAGVLISAPLGATATTYVDPYLSFMNFGFEYRIGKLRPFARLGANYVLTEDSAMVSPGLDSMFFSAVAMIGTRYAW
jgi:hypothetical protein